MKSLALLIAIVAVGVAGVASNAGTHVLADSAKECCHACCESLTQTHATCPCAACPTVHAPLLMALISGVSPMAIVPDRPTWDLLHEFAVTLSNLPEVPPPRAVS